MKNQKSFTIFNLYERGFIQFVLILGIAVLALGFVGFNLLKNKKVPPAPNPETIKPTSSASQDDTSNWTTYTNDVYNFSFSHPILNKTCCSIAGPADYSNDRLITLADLPLDWEGGTDAPFDGMAVYIVNNPYPTFDEFIKVYKQNLIDSYVNNIYGDPNPEIEETAIIIGDQNGVKHVGYDILGIERYFVPLPSKKYILLISKTTRTDKWNTTFGQIISTFKFIED